MASISYLRVDYCARGDRPRALFPKVLFFVDPIMVELAPTLEPTTSSGEVDMLLLL